MRCSPPGSPAASGHRGLDASRRRPMTRRAIPRPCSSTRAASPTIRDALAVAVGGVLGCRAIPGGARRRLLDPARLPARAQAPRPLRAALPRRPRRLLPARSRTERRGGVDGPGAGHRARSRGGDGIEGSRPLVRDEDVVVFGRRDAAEAEEHGSRRIEDTAIEVLDLGSVRSLGAGGRRGARRRAPGEALARRLLGRISTPTCSTMRSCRRSTTACPMACRGRNSRPSCAAGTATGRAVGIDITIFNPALDPTERSPAPSWTPLP